MKFGYRDRIILMVVLIVVILGVGIFAMIKPKWETLSANKAALESAKTDWDAQLLEFTRIPARQANIKKRYEEGAKTATEFTDEMTALELEEFLQEKFLNIETFKNNEVEMKETLKVTEQAATPLSYYYYIPNIVTYPLYEYADLDGSLAQEAAEKLLESNILAARTTQSVGSSQSSFTVRIQKEDLMSLLDAVKSYAESNHDAMMISSVEIAEYDFNANIEGDEEVVAELDEEGNPIPAAPTANAGVKKVNVKKNFTDVTITYNVYYMQEPKEPDVGPVYDETIWDGDEWRNPVE